MKLTVINRKAQSLLELSLYGVVVLSLLGVVLSYGMRYNFRQSADQRSFRKAMAKSADHMGSKTYVLMHDRSLPNPQDPFGTGQASPFVSSATITRDYRLLTKWDSGDPMPTITFGYESRVGETAEVEHTIAGEYRYCWPRGGCTHRFAREKYEEVVGANNVKGVKDDGPGQACVDVLDWCGGEIFGYEGCKKQCRMMQEYDYCVTECEKGRLYHDDMCADICSMDVPTFWYCGSIDNFFSFTGSSDTRNWNTGIQPRTEIESIRSETMTKSESPGGVSSSDTLSHTDNILRTIVWRPVGSGSPSFEDVVSPVEREPSVSMSEGW